MTRADDIQQFLSATQWADATQTPLAGDASNRRYFRLSGEPDTPAILMDAPPENGNDIRPFLNIAAHLQSCSLAAPQIYASDTQLGFIVLQDFGDDLFYDVVTATPAVEQPLYNLALDALDQLHQNPMPHDIEAYGIDEMTAAVNLAPIWYGDPSQTKAVLSAVRSALNLLDWSKFVLILRDFHAQNLVWRVDETGLDRVGLLDFQDAKIGHPLFDAASLIDDARRDMGDHAKQHVLGRLRAQHSNFDLQYSIINVQRNLRILGIFARLCLSDGKAQYVDFIPRVWRNLQNGLAHPDLSDLASALASLPTPTPEFLEGLKAKCGTHPAN